ncbi:Cytochrome P450 monooxygenase himC [Hyphodiscus hymeniophilus]|uniref:Cytochrome P450 monooxygenase himC n=1 Tax=Hyphodiscus hymeniophilus TaxID=353542 RepID=A0A9P6SJY5_9HELO|nr:Cytochrome P450 monooxygenase himC [Hyphodiscus hymeniophilus]
MSTPVFVAAGAFALLFLRYIFTYVQNYRFAKDNGCQPAPKLPQSERIIGYANFKQQTAAFKAKRMLPEGLQRFETTGDTFTVVTMGRKLWVTREPENVKAILATNFKDFGIGQRFKALGALLGQGIFTSDGALWEHSRALVRPSFTKSQVADLDTFETHIQHLIAKIPRDGSTVDLQTLFFQLTLDSATEFLLGESVDVLRSPAGSEQQLFGQAFDFAQTELTHRTRLGPFLCLYRNKEFDIACKLVHRFVDKFVVRALENRRAKGAGEKDQEKEGGNKYIFANELALATDDPLQIRAELLNILLAGRDTTAGLLSNTFWQLAHRPDVWAKLKSEVEELNGKRPDYETLRNMKYLKSVLNESLRLYPSVPGNARFANKNTTIPVGGGPDGKSPIFIPKGGTVIYSTYSMHRSKALYGADAEEYKPERWENLRVGWGYLPFNGGPRICVGQQFALTEAGYTIVRLLQEFERIESRDSKPWYENLHLTLSSGNGVKAALFGKS